MTRTVNQTPGLQRPATLGLWLLPVYELLLAVSTVTQQPDVETDFAGYARYITTGECLSHLVASIGGAALAVLGVMAAAVTLAAGRARRLA